ncbi:hypothetical protein XaCFBP7622_21050 [Xanthomonas arboricola]|nr:hypothetical protein XaCFBP7622_21050 [Xanthomonas arboricola]
MLCLHPHTDRLDRSLSVHRRGTLSGMDAAPEPTGTYLRRVPRGWAGKDRSRRSVCGCKQSMTCAFL